MQAGELEAEEDRRVTALKVELIQLIQAKAAEKANNAAMNKFLSRGVSARVSAPLKAEEDTIVVLNAKDAWPPLPPTRPLTKGTGIESRVGSPPSPPSPSSDIMDPDMGKVLELCSKSIKILDTIGSKKMEEAPQLVRWLEAFSAAGGKS